ncbi:AraC-like DNA-binding protein [Streptomyces sp. SAI-170]
MRLGGLGEREDGLETTDLAVDEIAGRVGFAGGTSLREHLHAAIGVSPLAYRRTFRGAVAAGDAEEATRVPLPDRQASIASREIRSN